MPFACFFKNGCHFHVVQAARDDKIENSKVILNVYRHAVVARQLRDPNADRGNLPILNPQARQALSPYGIDAQLPEQFHTYGL
jgi:hypothetical protein